MRLANYFFNGAVPDRGAITYTLVPGYYHRAGYSFSEYQAARQAVANAFTVMNWDGYGALPISDETKKNALGILSYLETATRAPEITPNPNGTLSLEWETSQGFGQLEIGRTRYSFYVKPHGSSPFLDGGDAAEVKPTVGWLLDAFLYPNPTRPLSATPR
jgi:hypothetical protein